MNNLVAFTGGGFQTLAVKHLDYAALLNRIILFFLNYIGADLQLV
ncbi:MAG: hypothetical protein ABJA66_19315 [Actinomycetota bacterium]